MKTFIPVTPAGGWMDTTVKVEPRYHSTGSGPLVVVRLGGSRQYGACLKFTPSKGKNFLANIHLYDEGKGSPTASVFFADGYADTIDADVMDMVPTRQTVSSQTGRGIKSLVVRLSAQAPDGETILNAVCAADELPLEFIEAVVKTFGRTE